MTDSGGIQNSGGIQRGLPLGLDGAVALVTGGARSFGRACAGMLARVGCAVVVVDVADGSAAVDDVEAEGREGCFVAGNMRDPDDVTRAVEAAVDRFGRLDVAVNTVGSTRGPTPLLDLQPADWEEVVGQNLTTAFLCTQAEARTMVRLGSPGRIVNVASLSGVVGAPNAAGYGAANAGVVHLTATAALELAPHGIRVNCIVPGAHLTEAVEEAMGRDPAIAGWVEHTAAATPLGRLGRMDEAAAVVLFLASDLSSYVTGQAVVADGGMARTTARAPMGSADGGATAGRPGSGAGAAGVSGRPAPPPA